MAEPDPSAVTDECDSSPVTDECDSSPVTDESGEVDTSERDESADSGMSAESDRSRESEVDMFTETERDESGPSQPVGTTSYETLVVERRGPVGWLIFDRPAAGNAMDATMLAELERAWVELDADDEVRVIVTTGNGRAFQTGLDVAQLARDPAALREQSRRTKRAELRLTAWHNQVWKPVIAAVNGVCAGGGLHFVADADIVVLAADATLVDPHVSIGQVSAYETIALVRTSPMESILRMALVGRHERVTAARAHQLGICSQVVDPPERLRDAVQALAEVIARNSPAAMAATKRALWGALEAGLTDACRAGAAELVGMWGHPDQTEGPLAFAEKRDAAWATHPGGSGHGSAASGPQNHDRSPDERGVDVRGAETT